MLLADTTATVSVVGSTAVALASLGVQVVHGRAGRRHARELALQDRRIEAGLEYLNLVGSEPGRALNIRLAAFGRDRATLENLEDARAKYHEEVTHAIDAAAAQRAALRQVRLLMPARVREAAKDLEDLAAVLVRTLALDYQDPPPAEEEASVMQLEARFVIELAAFEELLADVLQETTPRRRWWPAGRGPTLTS